MNNSPLASLANKHGINFDAKMKGGVQYAANNPKGTAEAGAAAEGTAAGDVNVANFRSHKQDQADRKNRAQEM